MDAFRLQHVTKSFPPLRKGGDRVTALHEVSIAARPGERLALIGPDAAGKSTLLRILAGVALPDGGQAWIFGSPPPEIDRSKIGFLPQSGGLYDDLSVARNLALYAGLRGVDLHADTALRDRLYDLTGLGAFRTRAVGKLSGGMRQKLALACALLARPPLLLLDEPSVGVDPLSRREIRQLVDELAAPDCAMVWATSVMEEAEGCDRVVVLHEGRIVFDGDAESLAQGAEDRVERREFPAADLRRTLALVEREPEVADARIEMGSIRVLSRKPVAHPVPATAADGFALLLDQGRALPPSALAEHFPVRERSSEQPVVAAAGLTSAMEALSPLAI